MRPPTGFSRLLTAGAAVAVLAVLPGPTAASAPPEPVSLARVQADGAQLEVLADDFDLTEHGHDGAYDVVLHPGDRARLDALGFSYEIVVDDLVATDIADRRAEARAQAADPSTRLTYRTLADYNADMDRLAARAPDLVRTFELPFQTIEGRTVKGIEVAADVASAQTDGRPTAMIDGIHHAREWPSGELPMMFAEDLVDSYLAGDPGIRDLLDEIRVLFVPVVNPDGFVRSRETVSDFVAPTPGAVAIASEFAYHRKNLRLNHGYGTATGFELQQGVDLNRNYTYLWSGPGASGSPESQTYFGPAAGSERETHNIQWLVERNHVLAYITNHTYSDLVLRPWGHTRRDAPDEHALEALGDAMAAHNGYRSQKGIDLYPTTGTAEDWVYAVAGALSYTFEIGSNTTGLGNATPAECAGFHPQYNLCIPYFYDLNRPAFLELLEATRDPSLHAVLTGTAPPGTTIEVEKTTDTPLSGGPEIRHTFRDHIVVDDSGSYSWHVNPSASPSTVDLVQRGLAPSNALEHYRVTARFGDGTTETRTLRTERGKSYTLDFGS